MDLNPKQQAFLAAYLDPQSETWSNAYQSAKKAGYAEEYAQNITNLMPAWLSENLADTSLVTKALANLGEFLDYGEDKKIQADMTKFTLTKLAKVKFGDKVDITSKGEAIKAINYIVPDGNNAPTAS